MRFFIYEFITGGGMLALPLPPSLLAEASAMLAAAAADFALLADADIWILRDHRLPPIEWPNCRVFTIREPAEELDTFAQLASAADWTLLIAPETCGELLRRCQLVEELGGKLLSPSAACIEITGNKQMAAEHLCQSSIRVPPGRLLVQQSQLADVADSLPLVVKPVDGCGSGGVRLINCAYELTELPIDGSLRLENYIPGQPASVAALCGPGGNVALPACEQRLSRDDRFSYLGGRLPLAPPFDQRARRLALAAVAALPEPRGYLGVDLVLGEADDGSQDYVIEINPRLTTSYVGLRASARTNLAAAMLAVCRGQTPDLCFEQGPVEFTADGSVVTFS